MAFVRDGSRDRESAYVYELDDRIGIMPEPLACIDLGSCSSLTYLKGCNSKRQHPKPTPVATTITKLILCDVEIYFYLLPITKVLVLEECRNECASRAEAERVGQGEPPLPRLLPSMQHWVATSYCIQNRTTRRYDYSYSYDEPISVVLPWRVDVCVTMRMRGIVL